MKVLFLGTPDFVEPVKNALSAAYTLTDDINQSDLLVVAAYGKILPLDFLNKPKYGAINIHPSLLPRFRGPSPIQAAILSGDKKTGVTIMQMDEKMDHGPILAQKEVEISNEDTNITLSKKLFQIGANMLIEVIPSFIDKTLKPIQQNHDIATFCKLIKKESGFFDIESVPEPEMLSRMIRAYYPWPGVWTKWNGKIVKFLPNGLIQMEGKKATNLKSFLNGYSDFPIKSL